MSPAQKAKRTLLGIEIPRDELALRIAIPCIGAKFTGGVTATQALDQMNTMGGPLPMGDTFRKAADAAVTYFHERINEARQPS